MPDDKNGKWVTINGTHIFIKDGQTVEEAFAERSKEFTDSLIKRIKWYQAGRHYDYQTNKRIMPKEYCQRELRRALETRAQDEELFTLALDNNVAAVIIKDTDRSWLSHDKGVELHISISGTKVNNCCTYFHEVGHAMDRTGYKQYMSSSFVSPKHGVTMISMFRAEFGSIGLELLHDEYDYLEADAFKEAKEKYESSREDKDRAEYRYRAQHAEEAQTSLVDMIQAIYGENAARKDVGGWLPHRSGYFTGVNGNANAGTELFAEICESLNADKNKYFYNIIKQYCPKTLEIYEEILDERRKQWKK